MKDREREREAGTISFLFKMYQRKENRVVPLRFRSRRITWWKGSAPTPNPLRKCIPRAIHYHVTVQIGPTYFCGGHFQRYDRGGRSALRNRYKIFNKTFFGLRFPRDIKRETLFFRLHLGEPAEWIELKSNQGNYRIHLTVKLKHAGRKKLATPPPNRRTPATK